jgi:hypothetical protein
VLVIIGLIVGGILAGRELIRSAELTKIITQKTSYETAVNTFKGKCNELPGDMTDATKYWGPGNARDNCTVTCFATRPRSCSLRPATVTATG